LKKSLPIIYFKFVVSIYIFNAYIPNPEFVFQWISTLSILESKKKRGKYFLVPKVFCKIENGF